MKGEISRQTLERARATQADVVSSDNDTAVITIAANALETWVILGIETSCDGSASNILLTVVAGSTTILSMYIGDAPFQMVFPEGLHNDTANEAVVVTLAAAGVGIKGAVNLRYV